MSSGNKKAQIAGMTTFNDADRRKILESLTSDELATFQEAFTVFDKNQDGTITTKVGPGHRHYIITQSYHPIVGKSTLELAQ